MRWIRQWWFDVKHQLVERPYLLCWLVGLLSPLRILWFVRVNSTRTCHLLKVQLDRHASLDPESLLFFQNPWLYFSWSLVLLSCTCHRCHQALRSGIWREKAKPCHKRLSILFPPCNSLLSLAPVHSSPKSFSPYTISIRYEMQSQTVRSAPALLSNAWPIRHSS